MRVVPAAWQYVAIVIGAALPALLLAPWLAPIVLAAAGFVLWFFRDPDRLPPSTGVVAPAEGRIRAIDVMDGRVQLSVFLSILDVHVIRAPAGGKVIEHAPVAGGYWPAFSAAADRNERVELHIQGESGRFDVDLIAGAVARYISTYVSAGDRIPRSARIGHIAFGSRVDVKLPAAYSLADVTVSPGDRVRAGETVIARRPDAEES